MLTFELAHTAGDDPAALADADWIPAVVPGGVHESLLLAGLIGHPYFGDNEASVRWIEAECEAGLAVSRLRLRD